MARYVVSAPMVYLKVPDASGAWVSLGYYAGAPVPEGIDPESLRHHLDGGMIIDADERVAEVVAVPSGTPVPGEPPNVPVAEAPAASDPLARLEAVKQAASEGQLPEGEPDDSWTVPQLQAYAQQNQVDLEGATRKADILAAIDRAREKS